MKTAKMLFIAVLLTVSVQAAPSLDRTIHRSYNFVQPQPVLRGAWLWFIFNFAAK